MHEFIDIELVSDSSSDSKNCIFFTHSNVIDSYLCFKQCIDGCF